MNNPAYKPVPPRPFEPGQSGNPKGRPATPPEVKEALTALTLPAVKALSDILAGKDQRLRLIAAQTVLDRTLGKAIAQLDVKVDQSIGAAHLEALKRLNAMAPAPGGHPVHDMIDVTPAKSDNGSQKS